MVLEALINPIKAERNPWLTFFLGMVYSTFAIVVSFTLFREHASIIMISLTAMASVPLIYGALKLEEKKDLEIMEESILFKEHTKALMIFIFLFLGFVAAFTLWYSFLPQSLGNKLFLTQLETIQEINNPITGNMYSIYSTFGTIFFNNIKVMAFCLLFAFFYGFGAIFILTWNASVFSTMIGSLMRKGTLSITPLILLRFSLHGIPEIIGYFLAGMAGGIISIALIRHDFRSKKFKHIIFDSVDLIITAIIVLLIAGLIEVFISPMITY